MPIQALRSVLSLAAVSAVMATATALAPAAAHSQVVVGIGVAPRCPYGYYDYAPYNCSPYGYYGPDWFSGGLFIGAGPWYHGRAGFYGHVDNRYDPRHGYAGPYPERKDRPFTHFQGNEARDGRGNTGNAGHEPTAERSGGFERGGGNRGGGHPR